MLGFKLLAVFGFANILAVVVAIVQPIEISNHLYAWSDAAVLLVLQAVVSLAMIYAAVQKMQRAEIAIKALPAALVAYVLWACMVWRWLGQ
ncbi:MAG: hypothetical protein P1U47_06130 [Zhongshania sp.]|uniref:hypothetical protein n=1 Tax=Zhongshania sp. TaxID=1971902 RepID=UPI002623EF08|nr:hypothetical protein [Zhongshania sp.]MDF1691929.1 hypothetical protein [Zhongshania sp.]